MRNGQHNNKRTRGRSNNNNSNNHHRHKNHNPLTRVYESNGPDVKIRGTANHVAEKYIQLARDAQSSGDPVAAENYYQHAEHYFRLIAAAQEQFRQTNQLYPQQSGGGESRNDDSYEGEDDGTQQPHSGGSEPHYTPSVQADRQPSYQPREQPSYQPREPQNAYGNREQPPYPSRPQSQDASSAEQDGGEVGLPSFITGGQAQPGSSPQPQYSQGSQNGHEGQADRFPLHRRRRRHRGPRPESGHPNGNGQDDGAARE